MQIPRLLFEIGLWAAVAGVAAGAVYLLSVLAYEWRHKELW